MFVCVVCVVHMCVCVCVCVLQAAQQMMKLYDVVYDNDVTMLEINPMVEALDSDGKKRGRLLLL